MADHLRVIHPTTEGPPPPSARKDRPPSALALAVLHAEGDPSRVGEIAWIEVGRHTLGRAGSLGFVRHRPRKTVETGWLRDPSVSREQLELEHRGGQRIDVVRKGRLGLRINGQPRERGTVGPGDVLEVGERLALYVHERPRQLPDAPADHPFGQADAFGIVGEGPAAWALRSRIAFVAPLTPHVLVHGPSGTGKELVARALHDASGRRDGPWVSRSAATIPPALAEAELFGNLHHYPNPGTPDRPGLVGEADRGTLFLDELGELPVDVQARLLRVLDHGEYSRLGEARARRSCLRLVAATNRRPESLKPDVLARMPLRVQTPALTDRREDVGLLVHHLLAKVVESNPALADLLFDGAWPRVATRFVATLATHPYETHVRELSRLLWEAIGVGADGPLDVFPHYSSLLEVPSTSPGGPVDPASLDPETIQACLDRHGGNQEATRKELGLSSRWVLSRLVRKHGLSVQGHRRSARHR